MVCVWVGGPFLTGASILSFDGLICGVCPGQVRLAEGDEILSGPSAWTVLKAHVSRAPVVLGPLSSASHLLEEAWIQSFPVGLLWPGLASPACLQQYHPSPQGLWSGLCPEEVRAAMMTDPSPHLSLLRSCSAPPRLNKVVSLPTTSGCFLRAFRESSWLRIDGVEGLPLGKARLSSPPTALITGPSPPDVLLTSPSVSPA